MKIIHKFTSALALFGAVFILIFAAQTVSAQNSSGTTLNAAANLQINLQFGADGSLVVSVPSNEIYLPPRPLLRALDKSLGVILTPLPATEEYDFVARCHPKWPMTNGDFSGAFHPTPLLTLLRTARVPWLVVEIEWDGIAPLACRNAHHSPASYKENIYYWKDYDVGAKQPVTITFTYGYGGPEFDKFASLFAVCLLMPILLTAVMVRRSLIAYRAFPEQRNVLWFRYVYFLNWLITAIWLAWIVIFISDQAYLKFPFFFGGDWLYFSDLSYLLYLFLMPFTVTLISFALSHPMYTKIGGLQWTRLELVRLAAWGRSRLLSYLAFFGGIAGIPTSPHYGVVWILLAVALYQLTNYGTFRAQGTYPIPILSGPLRQKMDELAIKAGVRLKQAYFLPAGKGRIANAYAMYGNRMAMTQTLLEELTPNEVDAVIAHELTHLRHRHPYILQRIQTLSWIVAVAVVFYALEEKGDPFIAGLVYPSLIVAGIFIAHVISRRFEYAADAGAVALTGDPAAAMSGLARISAINRSPLDWGKNFGRWLTHPQTIKRILALAKNGQLPAEETQAIIDGDPLPVSDERYDLPLGFSAQVFSVLAKTNHLLAVYWLPLIFSAISASLLLITLRPWMVKSLSQSLLSAAVVAAIVFLRYGFTSLLSWRFISQLKRRASAAFQLAPLPENTAASSIALLALGSTPRIYGGYYDWDIGRAEITNLGVAFQGELCRFTLPWRNIEAIEARTPLFLSKKRIYIAWINESGDEDAFSFALYDNAQTKVFLQRLTEGWKASSDAPLADTATSPLPPQTESVAGLRLRAALTFAALYSASVQQALISLGIAYLFYLPLSLNVPGSAIIVVIATVLSFLLPLIPLLMSRG